MKISTAIMTIGIAVAATLIANEVVNWQSKNKALGACKTGSPPPSTRSPLMRGWSNARSFGDKSAVEAEMQACPLGPTCSIGGVCACTFCRVKVNGVQNTRKSQSGAIQSWTKNPYACGRSSCYAAAIQTGRSCLTQVVATQGAAGTCGWGKCGDFASCC